VSKNIISFSLWGDNQKYTFGAVKNCSIAKELYPDWICRFYIGKSVPEQIVTELESFDNSEVVRMEEHGDWTSMFWRFLPASEEDVSVMISRDTDSRLSFREKMCVDDWLLNSDKDFHSIRDNQGHDIAILGGMWGCRNGVIKDMSRLINEHLKGDFWQVDQIFLSRVIYPRVFRNMISHDDFYCHKFPNSKPIPHKKVFKSEFVGKPYEYDDFSKHDGNQWNPESVYQ
jgi:hypothetical protein